MSDLKTTVFPVSCHRWTVCRLWTAGTAASSPAYTQQSGLACWYSVTGLQGCQVQVGRDAVQQDQG